MNLEFRKATFKPSQDLKATFMNRKFRKATFLTPGDLKVAFLNLGRA